MDHSNSLKPTTLIISVGGSLVVPNGGIDHQFLKDFKALIMRHLKNGWRFVIVVGGEGQQGNTRKPRARSANSRVTTSTGWASTRPVSTDTSCARSFVTWHTPS